MTYTPIAKGTSNWDVPLNAALAQLDANIASSSSTALQAASNLSDLTNKPQARTNLGLTGIANSLTNLTATTNPTASNDNTQGYSIGSTWLNTTTDSMFIASDVTTGAAVWLQIPATFVDRTSSQTVAGVKTFTSTINSSQTGNTSAVSATYTGLNDSNATFANNATATNARFLDTRITGDSFGRMAVFANGTIEWGTGAATRDVNLYRGGTDLLQTDDTLSVAQSVRAGTNVLVGSTAILGDNGVGEIQLANATTVPTTNPTGGALIYANGGSVNLRNSQGLVRSVAGAVVGSNVQTTVANTATETAIATLTIPANDMVVGAAYRIKAWGTFSNTGTPTMQFRALMGATPLGSTSALTSTSGLTNKTWSVEAYVSVLTTGSSGTTFGHIDFPNAFQAAAGAPSVVTQVIQDGTASVTTNTTISNTFTIAFKWGTADPANTLTCRGVIAERVI